MPQKVSPIAVKLKSIATELYKVAKALDDSDRPRHKFLKELDRQYQMGPSYQFSSYYAKLIPARRLREIVDPQVIGKVHESLHKAIKQDIKEDDDKVGINTEKARLYLQVLFQELPYLPEDILDVLTIFVVDQPGFKNVKINKNLALQLACIFRVLENEFPPIDFTFPGIYNGKPIQLLITAEQICRGLARHFAELAPKNIS